MRSNEWKITGIHIHQYMGCYTNGSVLLLCIICLKGLAWNKPHCNWFKLHCFHHGILLPRISPLASCKWKEGGSNKDLELHGKSQWKPFYNTKRCSIRRRPNNICKKGGGISSCLSHEKHKHKLTRCWAYDWKKCTSKSVLRWFWASSWTDECLAWHSESKCLWSNCCERNSLERSEVQGYGPQFHGLVLV